MTTDLIQYVIGEKTEFKGNMKMDHIYKLKPELGTKIEKKVTLVYGYNGTNNGTNRVYISLRKPFEKCLTFDMPFMKDKKILQHSILLNNTIFDHKRRPVKKDFEIFFHYPHQTMRRTASQSLWDNQNLLLNQPCSGAHNKSTICPYYKRSYTTMFEVDKVQVLKSRNKPKAMCIENWKNDDVEMRTLISKRLKCKPNHWKLGLNLTKCATRDKMSNASLWEDLPTTPSCRSIESYSFSRTEYPGLNLFDIETDQFKDPYAIDWNSEAMKMEQVFEINVHFVGKMTPSRK